MNVGYALSLVSRSTALVVASDSVDAAIAENMPIKPQRIVLLSVKNRELNGKYPSVSSGELESLISSLSVHLTVPVVVGRYSDLLAYADTIVKLSPLVTIAHWNFTPDEHDSKLTLLFGKAVTKFRSYTIHSRIKGFDELNKAVARASDVDNAIALISMRKKGAVDVQIKDGVIEFAGDPIRRWLYNKLGLTELVYRYNFQNPKVFATNKTDLNKLLNLIRDGALTADAATVEALFSIRTQSNITIHTAPYIQPSDLARFAELTREPILFDRREGKCVDVTTVHRTKYERTEVLSLHEDGTVSYAPVERSHIKLFAYLPYGYSPDIYSEDAIEELTERFELPKVATVDEVEPERYARASEAVEVVESVIKDRTGRQLLRFQRDDLKVLLAKGYGILGWDPGLGKTIAGLTFALGAIHMGYAKPRVLLVCPQDLVQQWFREIEKFFGHELASEFIIVRNAEDAIALARLAKLVPTHIPLYAITWYEALRSTVGEDQPLERRKGDKCVVCKEWIREQNGELRCSRGCPYDSAQYLRRSRDAAWFLKKFVKGGVLVVDEATYIKSDTSKRGIAARRLVTAKARLLLTGTPIKNLLSDLPMLLQLAAKPNSDAYPFPAETEGVNRFSKQFMVVERNLENGRRKLGPEPTNLATAQRMLSAVILRRTKDQTGEEIVPLKIETHRVPLTYEQALWYQAWCDDELFEWWFREAHDRPIHPIAKLLSRMSHLLFVTSHPTSKTATGHPIKLSDLSKKLPEPSEFTHKNRLTIDLAVQFAKEHGHCVVFAQTVGVIKFLAGEIAKHLVPIHLAVSVDRNGKVQSLPPSKRGQVISEFQSEGGVLLASISAMAHGHDLAFVNRAIIHSLCFAYDQYAQAIMRVHRIISERPVEVHVICGANTIDDYLLDLLRRKDHAAKQVLSGTVIEPSVAITSEELRKLWQQVQDAAEAIVVE